MLFALLNGCFAVFEIKVWDKFEIQQKSATVIYKSKD